MQLTEEQERWQKEVLARGMQIVENFESPQPRQRVMSGYIDPEASTQPQPRSMYLLGKLLLALDDVRNRHPKYRGVTMIQYQYSVAEGVMAYVDVGQCEVPQQVPRPTWESETAKRGLLVVPDFDQLPIVLRWQLCTSRRVPTKDTDAYFRGFNAEEFEEQKPFLLTDILYSLQTFCEDNPSANVATPVHYENHGRDGCWAWADVGYTLDAVPKDWKTEVEKLGLQLCDDPTDVDFMESKQVCTLRHLTSEELAFATQGGRDPFERLKPSMTESLIRGLQKMVKEKPDFNVVTQIQYERKDETTFRASADMGRRSPKKKTVTPPKPVRAQKLVRVIAGVSRIFSAIDRPVTVVERAPGQPPGMSYFCLGGPRMFVGHVEFVGTVDGILEQIRKVLETPLGGASGDAGDSEELQAALSRRMSAHRVGEDRVHSPGVTRIPIRPAMVERQCEDATAGMSLPLICASITRTGWQQLTQDLLQLIQNPEDRQRLQSTMDRTLTTCELVMGDRMDDEFYKFIHRNDVKPPAGEPAE